MDPDYLELFGVEAGQGAQTNPRQIWWFVCAGPAGEDADRERQRMLIAYQTMPHSARPAFLKRLHSVKADDAFGAITELEYASLLRASGVPFSWVDPLVASVAQQRNVDFALPNGLYAEVTTLTEPELPAQFRQLFLALSRDSALPPGVYAVTVGEGSPPVRRLRSDMRAARRSGQPLISRQGDWELRRIDAIPESHIDMQQAERAAGLLVLYDRLDRALQAKRKQGRESGVRDLTIGT
ncbi:MAG: hypothetical protein QOC98_2919 [Frankiaceae bacterium]|nr:hypothetical protein [Frankiaceae bacterium]